MNGTSELQHIRFSDLPAERVNPLFDRQLVTGDRTMLARIVLRKGCVVPLHSQWTSTSFVHPASTGSRERMATFVNSPLAANFVPEASTITYNCSRT